MRKLLPAILYLLCFLTVATNAQQASKTLIGGKSAGPFSLGVPFQQVVSRLGQPSSQTPTSADPTTTLRMYKKYKLAFLVNKESKIIGITVARTSWKTPRGLGVGSSLVAFRKVHGKGLKRGRGQVAFPQSGLAISHRGGIVKTVYVVKKDEVDKIKGDQLVIGGTRVGKLRLGRSSRDLAEFLGPPSQKKGARKNIWIYSDRGLRLGFVRGRLHLIGVTSGDWVTPSGLKVGRPFSEMKREMGKNYRIEDSSVFYDKWGLGARLLGDQIVELLIFNPKTSNNRG